MNRKMGRWETWIAMRERGVGGLGLCKGISCSDCFFASDCVSVDRIDGFWKSLDREFGIADKLGADMTEYEILKRIRIGDTWGLCGGHRCPGCPASPKCDWTEVGSRLELKLRLREGLELI